MSNPLTIHQRDDLEDRTGVFQDREEAGHVLATMLADLADRGALLLAIPSGGVPVGVEIARELKLPLDVAVASKIPRPGDPEAGYGAVAFDGTVHLDDRFIAAAGLEQSQIQRDIEATKEKICWRLEGLRGDQPMPELAGRPVVLVDDGLAGGWTMGVVVEALRKAGADELYAAIPTGHASAVRAVAAQVEAVYCPNVRSGRVFAVADAYRQWTDVTEAEAAKLLETFPRGRHR
ncbi:MAG: phosphoribosyltransferase [Phycisphaeraceae bacterium]